MEGVDSNMAAHRTVRNAPFSVHARGVPLFQKGTFNDVSDQASRALLDLRDIGSSGFWLFSTLSWFTLFSVLINIVSGKVRSKGRKPITPEPCMSF